MITESTPRRRYQRHVATLLEKIDELRYQLMLLRANGAQAAGLRELKGELETARHELAAAVAAAEH
jgi:hypothetical protein